MKRSVLGNKRTRIYIPVLLLSTAPAALADVRSWTGGTDVWSNAAAWTPNGVPTSADDLLFSANATYTTTQTTASIANSVAVTSGNVTLATAGQTLNVQNMLNVYNTSLSISGGGDVNANLMFVAQAQNASLALSGGTRLTVTTDIFLGNDGGDATVTLSGASTKLSSSGAYTWVGRHRNSSTDASDSTVSLTAGAELAGKLGVIIGYDGGKAKVTLDGAGTKISSSSGGLAVGDRRYPSDTAYASDGRLEMSNGAQLSLATNLAAGTQGGTGYVSVADVGTLVQAPSGLSIGSDCFPSTTLQSNGTLSITNGGRVLAANNINVGTSGGLGTATVSGVGTGGVPSKLDTTNGFLLVGYDRYLGTVAGSGSLTIQSGATSTIALGTAVGAFYGTGLVVVQGSGSSLAYGAGGLGIGSEHGNGTVRVENGATMTGATAYVGTTSATGVLTVQGVNTSWTATGDAYVGGGPTATTGHLGTGTINVLAGASANITGTLKVWNSSTTAVNLSGSGSKLTVGSIDLDGDVTNLNFTGGTLELAGGNIGGIGSAGSYQTLPVGGTLAGSGTIAGNLSAGSDKVIAPGTATAAGTLAVSGQVTGTGRLQMRLFGVGANGKLIVNGGNVSFGVIDVDLQNGYTPALGASFDLLDVTNGALASGYAFDFADAALAPGLAWDTSGFSSSGMISVSSDSNAAPEPGTTMLAMLAGGSILGIRRRRGMTPNA